MGEHNFYGKKSAQETENRIKQKAEELWHNEGCQQGRDLHYWLSTEKAVKNQKKKY